ncbi:hypothetical protein ES703_00067 [subsurface metagenome]
MPEVRARIFQLIRRNRYDILDMDVYFRAKIAALHRWLYFYLNREGRAEDATRLRRMTSKDRLDWLRREVKLPPRSSFYARAILLETGMRAEIDSLELVLPRIEKDLELLTTAISLKERESHFLVDLIAGLKDNVPERPEWREAVERVLKLVERRLAELREMLPPVVLTRVLQSRMFYRSYKAKLTPQPFAFLVAFVKTREPEKYPEEFMKSAIDFLTYDANAFKSLGVAITNVGALWLKRGKFTEFPAGAYFVDGREVRAVDWDEVEDEAKKFGLTPEELIEQIRYYCAFYRIRFGEARIYREYIGYLTFERGRWVIHPDWERTKVEPGETLIPEAPHPDDLEV